MFYCGYELNREIRKGPNYIANVGEAKNFELLMHSLNKLVTTVVRDNTVKNINICVSEYIYTIISDRLNNNLYKTFVGRLKKLGVTIRYIKEK